MKDICYIDLGEVRQTLTDVGISLTDRQIKRAAELDANGKRKLPFFVDPIDKKLKIDRQLLLSIYSSCQEQAQRNAHFSGDGLREAFDIQR